MRKQQNMDTNNTDFPQTATEYPCQAVRRIGKELADALNEVDDYRLAIVYPSKNKVFPISICLDRSFASQLKAMYAYRDALNAIKGLKPRSKAYRVAQNNIRNAAWALEEALDDEYHGEAE